MPLSDAGKNVALDALAGVAQYVSLHIADPGTTGANEAAGGVPSYARKAIAWNAASGGNLDDSTTAVFDVPAGTYTHFGLWSALTAGTFYGGGPLAAAETYAAQGNLTLADTDVTLS